MTTQSTKKDIKELALLSDLHLDRASKEAKSRLWDMLAGIRYDAALITGDISVAAQLQNHLALISRACWPRPVYFMVGNHDYFGASFAKGPRNFFSVKVFRVDLEAGFKRLFFVNCGLFRVRVAR